MDEINSASSALDVQAAWDNRYAAADQLWSGQPNGQLVTETRGLRPARALDVGCGEGADALWLAAQGWAVTALDVSRLALDRAADQAERAGVQVTWLHSGLVDAELPPASFDLLLRAARCSSSTMCRRARRRRTPTVSIPTTTSARPWWQQCLTTTGRSRSTRSGHGM
jgi:SAM-dependent methyltransferase